MTQYLVVVVDRDMASEVNYFHSREEAIKVFGEIAHDRGYEPEAIHGSGKSILRKTKKGNDTL